MRRMAYTRSDNFTFLRHYAEMVLVMLLGMGVLGVAAEVLFGAGALETKAPAAGLSLMCFNMTVPMVAWMKYRGHGWAANAEMAASMIVPTLFVIGLLAAGVMTDYHALMGVQHSIMFPAMFGVMLLRREEYSGGHGHHARGR
jgi:hypothetical protein